LQKSFRHMIADKMNRLPLWEFQRVATWRQLMRWFA
jgi:hypothetical protein